ncbi:MAG: peptidase T [Agathobacter sp.]|nr:peptidase T [Agathobacter sp.]
MRVEERFLNYVSYWTTSDENGTSNPTSEREFTLARVLEQELKEMGLEKVLLSDTCYVYGLLPATPGMENKKAIGLIAHMDTAPDFSGENVKPQIIENYDGNDILLKGNNTWLRVSDFPHLETLKGHRLITTDGTTLLGADDKAGIAEIMTVIEEIKNSDIPHGDIWICFTPDEEVGMGPNSFDLDYFKADYAYTVDGAYEADIAYENFNAASAEFKITGVSVHPGEAKDIMVNAALIGCEIAMKLPQNETPAHTENREGFYHLTDMSGDVVSASLSYIIRDHDKNLFESKLNKLRALEVEMNQKYGANTVELKITHSYENMLSVIEKNMHVVDLAKDAIFAVGLEPVSLPVRGGTDGARLSFMGLPCPNLGTGGYGFHGPYEHVSIDSMERVVKILKEIISNPIDE